MSLIPENVIAQILERCDIVETVSGYIPLKKTGRNFKANCPFHNEKTPSFVVNPDKQIFHCFGCSVGGNVISFVMKQERVEFPEELGLYRNIDTWLEDFTVEEISLADFLAAQLTRRVQQLLSEDQNVLSGFDQARIEFAHVKDGEEEDQTLGEPMVREVTKGRQIPSHFRLMAVLTPKISASTQDRGSLFERD